MRKNNYTIITVQPYGADIAVCPSKKALAHALKDYDPGIDIKFKDHYGHVWDLRNNKDGTQTILMLLNTGEDWRTCSLIEKAKIACLVSHEASHCVDYIFKKIAEDKPGEECKAYLLDYIVYEVLKVLSREDPKK